MAELVFRPGQSVPGPCSNSLAAESLGKHLGAVIQLLMETVHSRGHSQDRSVLPAALALWGGLGQIQASLGSHFICKMPIPSSFKNLSL